MFPFEYVIMEMDDLISRILHSMSINLSDPCLNARFCSCWTLFHIRCGWFELKEILYWYNQTRRYFIMLVLKLSIALFSELIFLDRVQYTVKISSFIFSPFYRVLLEQNYGLNESWVLIIQKRFYHMKHLCGKHMQRNTHTNLTIFLCVCAYIIGNIRSTCNISTQ